MRLLASLASDTELLAVAHAWLEKLAEGDYRGAFEMTAHDSYYGWNPDLIRKVVEGYGLPEPTRDGIVHRVTALPDRDQARHQIVERWPSRSTPDGTTSIGEIRIDVPLDGDWSDLTATFGILQLQGGIVLVLNEIHVFYGWRATLLCPPLSCVPYVRIVRACCRTRADPSLITVTAPGATRPIVDC